MKDSFWKRGWDDLLAPLRTAQEEQREFLQSPQAERFDTRTAVTLLTVAVMLTAQEYCFQSGQVFSVVQLASAVLPEPSAAGLKHMVSDPSMVRLAQLAYWALGQVLIYFAIPALIVKLVFRDKLSDYGLKLRGLLDNSWIYVAMYLGIVGPVLWASTNESFLHTYPFYRVEPDAPFWPRMICWELLYALQFVSLEFFFRGFMLHGCRRRFGAYSIFAMAVPYCMIHYHKPVLETLGAIAAGVILGYMSLRTRSIWLGAALHIAVAWTMDAAAVWQSR
jgi:uncharacterized protein